MAATTAVASAGKATGGAAAVAATPVATPPGLDAARATRAAASDSRRDGAAEAPLAPHAPTSELAHDFFLSHYQATGGDQVMTLELRLSSMSFKCWLDQTASTITKASMRAGVAGSKVFLLFLSQGVLARPFTLFEIETALALRKKVMLMHETDSRHGAFDFDEALAAPPQVAELVETHESLPWRRRRFEQDAILAQFVKNSGISPPSAAVGVDPGSGRGDARAVGPGPARADAGLELAPVPDSVPVLPETFSPRGRDRNRVLAVLLPPPGSGSGSGAQQQAHHKVLAHGMGGLGKTTLAASICRDEAVRRSFSRLGFISAGQEPATLGLQREIHLQCVGSRLDSEPGVTAAQQREVLQLAAAGRRWLLVLDDIWGAQHERELNFVDPAQSPESKVFVTTRFAKLLPGYVEVALGLLSDDEAVELLLGTADVTAPTEAQAAACKTIVKLSGHLPLYVSLVGRLVHQLGPSSPWETEVLLLLRENKASVLGDGGGDVLGDHIVGSSLGQVQDPRARELFQAMAALPEDVPAPMGALELLWCVVKSIEPPLGRIGRMKLRRLVFELLDRNLLLGETTRGVFMHDVVRTYSRHLAAATLPGVQRRLVQLLIAAAPPGEGWTAGNPDALNEYCIQGLFFHMSDAFASGGDPSTDADALSWLGSSPHFLFDHGVHQAARLIGAGPLMAGGEALLAQGQWWDGGKMLVLAIMGGEWSMRSPVAGDAPVLLKAADAFAKIAPEDSTVGQRSIELNLRGSPVCFMLGLGDARLLPSLTRIGELWELGCQLPESSYQRAMVATALAWGDEWTMLMAAGNGGLHQDEERLRRGCRLRVFCNGLEGEAMQMLAETDPMRIVIASATGTFIAHAMILQGPIGLAGLVDESSLEICGRLAGQHGGAYVCELFDRYDYNEHHELCLKHFAGIDMAIWWSHEAIPLVAGDLTRWRLWNETILRVWEQIGDAPGAQFKVEGFGNVALAWAGWLGREAGSSPIGHRALTARKWTWLQTDETFASRPICQESFWDESEHSGVTFWHATAIKDLYKIAYMLVATDLGGTGGAEDVDMSAFAAWLPPPGMTSDGPGPATYDLLYSMSGGSVACAYERVGRYADGAAQAAFQIERFPFVLGAAAVWHATAGRCQSALGDAAAAALAFDAAITVTTAKMRGVHAAPFLECMIRRDAILHGAQGDREKERAHRASLAEVVAQLPLPVAEYRDLIGHGLVP